MSQDQESNSPSRVSGDIKFESDPPSLNYDLRDRKKAIAWCWSLIVFDSCILALALFYPLWYGTSMSKTTVVTIVSCLVGVVSLGHFAWRTWVLVAEDSQKRPLGGTKWQLDAFQWVFALGVVGVTLELTFGTIPNDPIIGLISMPTATVMFTAAGVDLLLTAGYFLNITLPVGVSSLKRGDFCRPGVYTIIEDIVAVDGSGCKDFREALDKRYRASPHFRHMLAKISLFWSIPALAVAAGITAVVWTTSTPVAFGVGWGAPFVWAAIWAVLTFMWVPRMLQLERRTWKAMKQAV